MTYHEGNSWVIVNKATGKAVWEIYTRQMVDAVRRDRYDVVPIGQWLAMINQQSTAGYLIAA